MTTYDSHQPSALELDIERLLSSSPSTIRRTTHSVSTSLNQSTAVTYASVASKTGSAYPKLLTLDIGGQMFRVTTDTLFAESGLFQLQLSDRFCWRPEADGSYPLDTDPVLFNRLLQFMRRPSVFPLFSTKDQSFNFDLYQRLQAEAQYFQIDTLHT